MLPATLAIVRFTFEDEDEHNVAIAVWSSVSIGGIAFGPLVGGLLPEWLWWGSVFPINVPFAVVTLVLAAIHAPTARTPAGVPWDLMSSVLALTGLTGLVAAIKQGVVSDRSAAFTAGALLTSLVCFWWFVRRRHNLWTPLLGFEMFGSLISVTLRGSVYAAYTGVEPVHGAEGYEASPMIASAACLLGFLGTALLLRRARARSR